MSFRFALSTRLGACSCRFVIKTVDDAGRKVFINVCGSTKIPAPGGWTDGQVWPLKHQPLLSLLSFFIAVTARVTGCIVVIGMCGSETHPLSIAHWQARFGPSNSSLFSVLCTAALWLSQSQGQLQGDC